jgi:hypothetical protein
MPGKSEYGKKECRRGRKAEPGKWPGFSASGFFLRKKIVEPGLRNFFGELLFIPETFPENVVNEIVFLFHDVN